MDDILSLPLAAPSLLAVPTLETIPGSIAPTPPSRSAQTSPTLKDAQVQGVQAALGELQRELEEERCEAGPSRLGNQRYSPRSAVASPPLNIPGSYFPSVTSTSSGPSRTFYIQQSPAASPRERPRVTPLEMPLGTPEDPTFSNYPSTAPSRTASIHGMERAGILPLASAFELHLGKPITKRRTRHRAGVDESGQAESSGSSSPAERVDTKGRRRAHTVSHGLPALDPAPIPAVPAYRFLADTSSRPSLDRNSSSARRRASVGSPPFGAELHGSSAGEDTPAWPTVNHGEHRRMSQPLNSPSFAFPHHHGEAYAMHTVSAVTSTRPLASPHITPRRSSLSTASLAVSSPSKANRLSLDSMSTAALGLTNILDADGNVVLVLPEDSAIPHVPPPRRSSLSFGPDTVIEPEAITYAVIAGPASPGEHGGTSILSASLTTTEESMSAELFSPTSSGPHPLSSATTSLSRSAKSSKEGDDVVAAKDAALTALKLQRSLEWEAKQTRHRRKLEKSRMILLELVETEVTYAEDLKALVEVYLPQLHALPSVPDRYASAVGRNAAELLVIHSELSLRMVDVLKEEGLGYEMLPEEDMAAKVERVSRKLASALVDQAGRMSAYNEFCSGSITASTLVRNISLRTDYTAFERRCQIISSSHPQVRLQDLLTDSIPLQNSTNKNRLHFRDYLIMPIQRVCRYPLLLAALLGAADTPSASSERPYDSTSDEFDVGVDVERALGAMRGVAEEADEARRQKETELRTATILSRLELHQVLTPTFVHSLGTCRLIGSLDVLHHHPTIAPLVPPVKVKYLAAFLYRGYLVLAKVKKTKVYEAKHFLPLEVFELIDIAEGFLPHSIRLSLRDHSFDLAASCEAEKEVWAAALIAARNESTVPPFELPASVSPFAARSRRVSHLGPAPDFAAAQTPATSLTAPRRDTPNKRHTLAGPLPTLFSPDAERYQSPNGSPTMDSAPNSPNLSPSPMKKTASQAAIAIESGTILLRRATPAQRLIVDRGLVDVFSESCAQARSKAQLHHALFLPSSARESQEMRDRLSMRESTMLRRRRSFLDSRQRTSSVDISFTGEVKGSVIPIRPTRSSAGSHRHRDSLISNGSLSSAHGKGVATRPRRSSLTGAEESATEMDNADDTATSDFGTLRGYSNYRDASGTRTRGTSAAPSPTASPIKTLAFRPSLDAIESASRVPLSASSAVFPSNTFISAPPTRFASLRKTARRSASVMNLYNPTSVPDRAKSTPASPVLKPQPDATGVKRSTSDPDRPPLPPLPLPLADRPVSATDTGIKRLSINTDVPAAEPAEEPDSAIYILGNGLTNQAFSSSSTSLHNPGAGAWGTLRRSLTSRSNRNSVVGLDEIVSSSGSPQSSNPALSGSTTTTTTHNRAASASALGAPTIYARSNSGWSTLSGAASGEESVDRGTARGEEEDASPPVSLTLTPRRRRSVRLLQSFRGFTAL